jgi:TolB-like protein/Tfp pilus assembly protein PilF
MLRYETAMLLALFRRVWSQGVTEVPLSYWSEPDQKAVREHLDRIVHSGPFHQSQRRQRFLEYLVNETLAGRAERLKGYTIALAVFDRPETFDPVVDPLVRIEAGRLREKLREYYAAEGQNEPIRIDLPKGNYTPYIEFRPATAPEPLPGAVVDERQTWSIAEPQAADRVEPDSTVSPSMSLSSAPLRIGWKPLAILAAAALLIIVVGFSWMNGRNAGPPLSEKPSIAVLPFDNIGGDPKWGRLADGITEDIITDLSHSRGLIVIARNSTEVYKGRPIDIRQVGRGLGVRYVLEGSIQPMGERVRVTAQLIEAASGSHVWSERYDRPVDDLFAVQNDVTGKIAATLASYRGAVAEAERNLLRRKPPANLTAFDTYLLALDMKHKVTKESLLKAESLLRKALELDPQLARAHVALVDVYFYLIDLGLASSVDEAVAKLTEAAEKAVQLDPDDGKTHQSLGIAYAYHGKPEQALAEYDRAETLAPSDADLLLINAWAIPQFGQSARAVILAEQALKLNPHYPDWYNQGLGIAYFFGEQFDKSAKYRLLVKEPLALDYAFLAMAHAYLGRTSETETAAAKAKKLDPAWIAERYLSEAGGYAEKEAEVFVNGARKAGLSDCVPLGNLKDMPKLIHVKSCDQKRAKSSE